MQITFKEANATLLANDLAARIQRDGFNVMAKNDFYDFVLYLLDKHSEEHFLRNCSNNENALMLKTKPEKIKTSKLNIYLRFFDAEERKKVMLNFIEQLSNNKISMDECDKTKKLLLTIEDPAVYFCIAGKMKEKLGIGHDTSFNREILKIRKQDFFTLLNSIVIEDEIFGGTRSALEKKMRAEKFTGVLGDVVDYIMDGVSNFTGEKFADLMAGTIKAGIKKFYEAARQ